MPAPLVILNPSAGGGRAARLAPWLAGMLQPMAGGDLVHTRGPGHATELAAVAADDGRERIVVVGGDGTIQEVVDGLMPATVRPTLGIVPQGSGNDLARSLGLPRGREAAWSVAIGAGTRRIDVGLATSNAGTRHFASAGGMGFDAQVAAAMTSRRMGGGPLGYLLMTLNELRRYRNRRVRIALDDGPAEEHTILLVAVTNGAYYGGGMRISPAAVPDDGWLDLCIVGDLSRLAAVGQLPNLYRGTHVRHRSVTVRRARRVRVEGDASTLVHVDGEPFGVLPVTIDIVPSAVAIAVRRQAD